MANIGRGGKSAHKGKAKSARKPLNDVSNTRKRTQSVGRISTDKDPALDRLVVVHSDLSNLIHQIDELVGQALKHQTTCKLRVQELESFADVLSNMHSTLKMWDIRFKQACRKSITESTDQFVPKGVPVSTEQEKDQDDSSEKLDLDTLLSPSPLVSWRAGCRVDSGRQLFLLTPLPQTKTVPSRGLETMRHKPKRLLDVGLPPRTISLPPSSTSVSRFFEAVEGSEAEPAQKNFPKSATFENVRTFDSTYDSPSKTFFQNIEKSVYLVDSLQKFSPLRTCVLLEPTSKHFQSSGIKLAASIQGCETEESPDLESAAYPDFLHLVTGNVRRNTIESSLDWFLSPPKTCVVMEPPNEKTGSNGVIEEPRFILAKESTEHVSALDKDAGSILQSSKHGISNAGPVHQESTPMWKDIGSTVRRGKRPGENTLKRELWTKFEAASTSRLEFNLSAFEEPETKGFLDRLEEVLCEERD